MSFTRFLINLHNGRFFQKEPGSIASLLAALILAPISIAINTIKNLPGIFWGKWDKGFKKIIGRTLGILTLLFALIAKGLHYPFKYILFPIIKVLMIVPGALINIIYSSIMTLAKKQTLENKTYNTWIQTILTFSFSTKKISKINFRPIDNKKLVGKYKNKIDTKNNITPPAPQLCFAQEEPEEKWYDTLDSMEERTDRKDSGIEPSPKPTDRKDSGIEPSPKQSESTTCQP